MLLRTVLALSCVAALFACVPASATRADECAFSRVWDGSYQLRDWDCFCHFPNVSYPQSCWGHNYDRSSESLYFRYPQEVQIPVYDKKWQNELPPQPRRYYWSHHFLLDVF